MPSERADDYATVTKSLTEAVQHDLKWDDDSIDCIGLTAATVEHGTEGIFFLDELGVNTRSITLLILWGWTAECAKLHDTVSEACGIGTVILPETGVVLRTVRMPSLDGDWWEDPLHQALAVSVYTGLVEHGKAELDGSEPYVHIASPATWN